MEERRQLVLLLVGVLVLTTVGIVAAVLFPEPCEELERRGSLPLAFTDAADALPLAAEDGRVLEDLSDELGIGAWRGAVALPDDAMVSRSEFGFFVADGAAFTVLRPSIGVVSAARDRTGVALVPAGLSLAMVTPDGTTGVFDGEFSLDRCGQVPTNSEVLALDRGIAVVRDGDEVVGVTLSGDEGWRAPAVAAAHVATDAVVLGDGTTLELRDQRDGEVLDRSELEPSSAPDTAVGDVPWLWAAGDRVLVRQGAGLHAVEVGEGTLAVGEELPVPLADGWVLDAVGTPAGVIAVGTTTQGASLVSTDRATAAVELPDGVTGRALHASDDGHVGLVVEVDGVVALLVWGPDA